MCSALAAGKPSKGEIIWLGNFSKQTDFSKYLMGSYCVTIRASNVGLKRLFRFRKTTSWAVTGLMQISTVEGTRPL